MFFGIDPDISEPEKCHVAFYFKKDNAVWIFRYD